MRSNHTHSLRQGIPVLLASCLLLAVGGSQAADNIVRVSGLTEPADQAGCSLFAEAVGFPMENASACVIWKNSAAKGVNFLFTDVTEGTYAASIGHDLNNNKIVNSNFIGMSVEQWEVSKKSRPNLRAPRFDEALFQATAGAKEVIAIKVAK